MKDTFVSAMLLNRSKTCFGKAPVNCGKEMKIIAFITNHQEVKIIIKHIGEENERAPPLPAIMRYELEDSYDWGDFPPDEAYFCDGEWGL